MKLTMVGSNAAIKLSGVIQSKYDYIDITTYPTLSDFYAKATIRSLDIDRMMVFEDGVDKTEYRKQFTGLVEYLGKNYPAIRLIMLFRDSELASESTRILVSPLYTTMVLPTLKMTTINDLVEMTPDQLKSAYGYVLPDRDLEDDLNETYDDSVAQPVRGEMSRTSKLPKAKEKKRGFFGLFKKQKPVPVPDMSVEGDINEVLESDIDVPTPVGGVVVDSPEVVPVVTGVEVDDDDDYPSFADDLVPTEEHISEESDSVAHQEYVGLEDFKSGGDIDSELSDVLASLEGVDTPVSDFVKGIEETESEYEDDDFDGIPFIDDLLDGLEEKIETKETPEPVTVVTQKNYDDILKEVAPFEGVEVSPVVSPLDIDLGLKKIEPEFDISDRGKNAKGELALDVSDKPSSSENNEPLIDIEGRKFKLKSMSEEVFSQRPKLVDDTLNISIDVEDVDVVDIVDIDTGIANLDELEDIYRSKNTRIVEKVVERKIEVPVEKVVEKIVEVPVERKVEVEKVVEVERIVHVGSREKVYRNGVRMVIVTGDRKTGVTKTALSLSSYFAKRGSTLFVDMDKVRKGSLLYLGLDEIINTDTERQNGLLNIKTVEALQHLTYRHEKGRFDCLLSLYGDVLSDNQVSVVAKILSQQKRYQSVIIDCPLEDLHLLEHLIPFAEVVTTTDTGVKDVLSTIMGLSRVSSVTASGAHLLNNAHYVIPMSDEGDKFARSVEYVKDLFGLGEEDLDWSMIPLIATKSSMVEMVSKL